MKKGKSNWKNQRFSDFVEIAPKVSLQKGAGYSFVEMADLRDGNKFCAPAAVRAYDGGGTKFQNGDTLFARITPCLENGKICQVRGLVGGGGFGSTEFHVFRGIEGVSDTDFVYYLSRWAEVREFAEANFHGTSGRQRVPKDVFVSLFLDLPPLSEQCAIAAVLSSLDDKIDLLHRQSKTLESLASALWRKMFIEEAAPEWEVGILRDYIDVVDNRGKTPPFIETKTDYPIIEVNALTGTYRLINYAVIKKYVTGETYNNWFRAGHPTINDILISTVGSIGEISMFLIDKGTIAQNVVALRATKTSPFYLYQYLKHFQDDIKAYDIGSVQPSIKVTHFVKTKYIQPPNEKLKAFDAVMRPVINKLVANHTQAHTVASLRDEILPKLMHGDVRVKV